MKAILVSSAGETEIVVDPNKVPQRLKHNEVHYHLSDYDGPGFENPKAFYVDKLLSEIEAKRVLAIAHGKL